MKLLAPENIKDSIKNREEEARLRSWKAANEEANILKRLNDVKDLERKQKEASKNPQEDQEIIQRRILIANQKREIELLEERRSKALQPIKEIEKTAMGLLEANRNESNSLKERENVLKKRENLLIHRTEQLDDERDELNIQIKSLDRRQSAIEASEKELKHGNNLLSEKWLKYHSMVSKKDIELKGRERTLQDYMKATDIMREAFVKKEKELFNRDKALTDKYNNLVKASEEFEKIKHEHFSGQQ